MGDRDLLRQVLVEQFGARIHFARVNMKPGKPTTFATCTLAGRRVLLGTADTAGSIFNILCCLTPDQCCVRARATPGPGRGWCLDCPGRSVLSEILKTQQSTTNMMTYEPK